MSSTWMPRAATSVATSTLTRPRGEPLEVARAARLVEVAVQRDGAGCRRRRTARRASRRTRGCGRRRGSCRRGRRAGRGSRALSRCSITSTRWSIVRRGLVFTGDLVHGRARRGTRRRASATPLVERRREEQLLRRRRAVWRRMRCTGSRKPRSHMWSASSSTVTMTSREVELALLDEVLDAAGGADDDVDAASCSAPTWRRLRHAAVDLRGEEADAAARSAAWCGRSAGRARASGRG